MTIRARRSHESYVRDRTRWRARNQRRRRRGWALLLFGLLLCLSVATYFLWYSERATETTTVATVDRPTSAEPPQPPAPARSHAVEWLHSKLPGISEAHAGVHGVVIFDPYSGETASLNADRRFVAASLSKLYALLTLYRAASRGELSLDHEITMRRSDVWAEGTGVLYKYPVGYTLTLRECAELMIKESDNTAELMLNRYLGEENIEAELNRIGATSTAYWIPNTTTPNDVLLVLKAIADPSYTTPELSAEMLDVMTDTSFEDRLPQPLPEGARVAHKIGSYESTFSDAGIVFPERRGSPNQKYYIVIFSEGAPEGEARETIQDISLAAYQALSRSDAP
jgi:beta-lactamase class A